MNTLDKVIKVASREEGYLEKNSASCLDDKTANAGRNNFTKYWRDLAPGMQGQPWCQCFVDWAFTKAYGEENARKLLHQEDGWSFYTPTAAQRFKDSGQWHTSPKMGDIIYFKNSQRICHVGLVYDVSGGTVRTIEGNTSGASGVVANGGGVFKKSYQASYERIAGYGRPAYDIQYGIKTEEAKFFTLNTLHLKKTPSSKGEKVKMKELSDSMKVKCYKAPDGYAAILAGEEYIRARKYTDPSANVWHKTKNGYWIAARKNGEANVRKCK